MKYIKSLGFLYLNPIAFILTVLFFSRFLEKRFKNEMLFWLTCIITYITLVSVNYISMSFEMYDLKEFVYLMIMMFIALNVLFKDNYLKMLLVFQSYMLFSLISSIILLIINVWLHGEIPSTGYYIGSGIKLLVYCIVFTIISFTMEKFLRMINMDVNRKMIPIIMMFPMGEIILLIGFIYFFLRYNLTIEYVYVIAGTGILTCIEYIYICIVAKNQQKKIQIENNLKLSEIKNKLMLENYKYIEENIQQTNIIWHDIKKHLQTMSTLIERNEIEKVKEYLSFIQDNTVEILETIKCKNKVVNAILTNKISIARKKGISLEYDVNIPEDVGIYDLDLCSLFLNTLDNAIEACEKIESKDIPKSIKVKSHLKKGYLYLEVKNFKENEIKRESGKFITLKEDSQNHGLGITIIKNIVEKYNGFIDIKYDEITFNIIITLRCI